MNTATVSKSAPTLPLQKKGLSPVLVCFLYGCVTALAIFLPFLIVDKGFYLYAGDYNQQQIPFNYYLQGFIKQALFEGGGTWSWATDIGSSAINSYSFYNLGSPYFWLSLLFPQSWMPYLMVPLFCLKFGSIAAAACLYLKRYSQNRSMLIIVSLIYAFCGFNTYNIFFNHMLEPVVLFPLMLWALDGCMHENKKGFFAITVGLALLNSYFFFAGNAVFIAIYFVVKLLTKEYRLTRSKFFTLAFEVMLGIGIGMVLFAPAVLNLMGNPRTSEHSYGMSLLVYSKAQQYFNIFWSLFVPQDTPWSPNLFTEGSIKWTSMSAFLPIVSMAGVIAYCRSRKGGSTKWILGICLLCAMVPVLNSAFYAFNSSYYARWYYMPILFMCLATMHSLESEDVNLLGGVKITLLVTAVYAIWGLLPDKDDEGNWVMGVAQIPSKFWLTFCIALLGIFVFYILVRFFRQKPQFARLLLASVLAFSVLYTVTHIALGKFTQWERDVSYKSHTYDAASTVQLPEDQGFYRIDDYELNFDNLGLWLDKSGLQSFNSVITTATMDFYTDLGLVRNVRSNPDNALYALRGLLSVRYTFVPTDQVANFEENIAQYGWSYSSSQGTYSIYENDNFIPLGFTYDDYLNMDYLRDMSNKDARTNLLVRAIGLEEEQIEQYGYLFTQDKDDDYQGVIRKNQNETNSETQTTYQYDLVNYDTYVSDAAQRAATASYATSYDSHGFTVQIELERENLVFFGVPYDEGFTAYVDGVETEIIRVSGGMMAVLAQQGDHTITFDYKTPGLHFGALVSMVCLLVLAAYMLTAYYLNKKRGAKTLHNSASGNDSSNTPEITQAFAYNGGSAASPTSNNGSIAPAPPNLAGESNNLPPENSAPVLQVYTKQAPPPATNSETE